MNKPKNENCSSSYHKEKNANEEKQQGGRIQCLNCGKEFVRTKRSKRSFCTRICTKAWGRREEIKELRKMAAEEKSRNEAFELRDFALEMYYKGYGRKAIGEALGLQARTLPHWIERYTKDGSVNWQRKTKSSSGKQGKLTGGKEDKAKPHCSYSDAETADEWLSALWERTKEENISSETTLPNPDVEGTFCYASPPERFSFSNRPIYIVCGVTNINKNADGLSTVIEARLQRDPYDGAVYVFCGKCRDRAKYIYWDGSGFNVVSRRREKGTYPWPSAKVGVFFAVSLRDMELIYYGNSKKTNI